MEKLRTLDDSMNDQIEAHNIRYMELKEEHESMVKDTLGENQKQKLLLSNHLNFFFFIS